MAILGGEPKNKKEVFLFALGITKLFSVLIFFGLVLMLDHGIVTGILFSIICLGGVFVTMYCYYYLLYYLKSRKINEKKIKLILIFFPFILVVGVMVPPLLNEDPSGRSMLILIGGILFFILVSFLLPIIDKIKRKKK